MKSFRALAVVIGAVAALLALPAGAYASANPGATSSTANAVPLATIHGCPAGGS